MTHRAHPGVDAYLAALPDWQRELGQTLRELIHEADPDITETVKRSVQPYFVLDGNVAALLATKTHVNLFLYDPTVADPQGVINQGHGNATARSVQIFRDDELNRPALIGIVRAIADRNRRGGWRTLGAE